MTSPHNLLEDFAHGSFGKVLEENNKLFLIETKTVKVKNQILRDFVAQAKEDGFSDSDLLEVLLQMDEAIEDNNVKNKLSKYLK
jgi:DNA-binding transcriptional regulator YhcF (GntR family)